MSSATDELSQHPGDSDASPLSARFREASASSSSLPDGPANEEAVDVDLPLDEVPGPDGSQRAFSADFAAEIRLLLRPPRTGLFGRPKPDAAAEPWVLEISTPLGRADQDPEADIEDDAPSIFLPRPVEQEAEERPIELFLPAEEASTGRSGTIFNGFARTGKNGQSSMGWNLFGSSTVAPAEVAFVPAEAIRSSRYRWLVVVIGLVAVLGAVWLTWLAQSGDTVNAPVATIEQVTTTASTVASSSETSAAATSTASTVVETTVTSTVPSSVAAPLGPQVTTAPRPATTSRPRTTAAPTTTEASTSEPTIPGVTFVPPTVAPTTTVASTTSTTTASTTVSSTTTAPSTTAAPTTTAPTTTAPSTTAAQTTTVSSTTASSTTAAPTTTAALTTTESTRRTGPPDK